MIGFRSLLACGLAGATCAALAQTPTALSAAWAQQACNAWNAEPVLTEKLVESGWVRNDGGHGFKAMQIYRADCPNSARVEMQISFKDGKALCTYGGARRTDKLDSGVDYLMWAESARWREMGAGEYGPMRAMMTGRLQFSGPKMEAMGNMGPFERFLQLVGSTPANWDGCPP